MAGQANSDHFQQNSASSSLHHLAGNDGHHQHLTQEVSLSEDEILRRLSGKHAGGNPRLKRSFLLKLAVALHSYGSSASRTEYLIDRAADRLNVETSIAVFPSLILLSFPMSDDDHDTTRDRKDIHVLTVDSQLDVNKLGRTDQLANRVGKEGAPVLLAYWRLKAIAKSPPAFGIWWRLFCYSLSSAMASLLFFDGGLWDGAFSFLLGCAVGILELISSRSPLFATVLEFSSACVVSFLARVLSVYLKDKFNVCYFSMALSAVVQLLPGMPLTVGVSEMVAESHVTGTSRVMYALFAALQLGFGLAVGEDMMWWAPKPSKQGCPPQDLPIWTKGIWFAGFTFSSNVLLNARLEQWPGMVLSSFVGYVVSQVLSSHIDQGTGDCIAAFAVGLTGTAYSNVTGDLPLVMVLSGILLLVPGGIGVRGVEAMLKDDVLSGMGFVFNMLVVGLSITIGLLMSKLVLPSGLFGAGRLSWYNKFNLATQLVEDGDDAAAEEEAEEIHQEHMAI